MGTNVGGATMKHPHYIGLYIHIPFCQHKCLYCDFYSVVTLEAMDRFVDALCREIRLRAERDGTRDIVGTMFWGGGTPSLLKPEHVERIAQVVSDSFDLSPALEWTIEANPGTVTLDNLRLYRRLGVNRLSFGVQSFDERELHFLERIHSAEQAEEAVALARAAGFDNINLDIMYSLPGQDLQTHMSNLNRACRLAPEHISAYSLVYEPGTPLYHQRQRGLVIPLDEEQEAQLYAATVAFLTEQGYSQYEVSNFARDGKQCRHNLLYWHRGEYLGFGPSAHSHRNYVRWSNVRSLQRYLDTLSRDEFPIAQTEYLSIHQQRTECVFLGLRADGIELSTFEREFGLRLTDATLGEIIQQWVQSGWAHLDDDRLRLTSSGYGICDALTIELLEAIDRVSNSMPASEIL